MKPTIFVTRLLPQPAMDKLEDYFTVACNPHEWVLSKKEIVDGVRGKDALLCLLTDTIDYEVLEACAKVRVISNYAVGFNNIDIPGATQRKLPVCNTPGVLTESTADLTWALILGIARRVVEGDVLTRTGQFDGWGPMMLLGTDVYNKTLGIVGMGRIGAAVARRAAGFSMRILYTGSSPKPNCPGTFCSMDQLLAESDFVTIHCPFNPKTRHLIGAGELQRMKRTAFIINTARGPIIDEKALLQALRSGTIAGAGLDVYEEEPRLTPGLAELDNVILLPHIGSATIETRTRMALMAVENAIAIFEGKPPHSMANPEVLTQKR